MRPFIWILISGLMLLGTSDGLAVSLLSTDSGASQQAIQQGVSNGVTQAVAQNGGSWLANGMDGIGNWALQALFQVYDKYIGTFLIMIPDLASPQTYNALLQDPTQSGQASLAIQEVLNLLLITGGLGLYLLVVFFVIDLGQRSSGFNTRVVEPGMVLSFAAAFIAIFAWPYLDSLFTNAVTALGYYIYNQNTLKTSGVLEGFANIDLNAGGGLSAVQANQINFRGNFISSVGIVWDFVFLLSIGLVVLGFYNCYSAVSAGDSKNGNFRFFQAVAGLILVLGVPTLIHTLVSRGAAQVGSSPAIPGETLTPFSTKNLIQNDQIQYPPQQAQQGQSIGTAENNPGQPQASNMSKFCAGLLKVGAALWGLIVCFGVIFAKFIQVLNLWVLFILGPAFIGLLGHPATAPIFWGALRYYVKLLLYSVIWAITLVGLYLIPNINWGIETIGVNSLLTACAVIAGLQMIGNAHEFAALFTTFHGANLKGEGIKDFTRDTMGALGAMNTVRLKTFGGLKSATGETGQAMTTAAGAAVGSVVPFVGTAAGALAAQRMTQGLHWVGRVGSMGNKEQDREENPGRNLIKQWAGNAISRNLEKDSRKGGDYSGKESNRRQAVGAYARRLQRVGEHPGNRGTGGDKRHGNPS